jgi:HSP20 family protein
MTEERQDKGDVPVRADVRGPGAVLREMDRMFQGFRRGLEDVFSRRFPTLPSLRYPEFRTPVLDLRETDGEFVLTAEMPGVNREDVDIRVTEDRVKIKAESREEREEKVKGYYRRERGYAAFYREVSIPEPVVAEKAKAVLHNGVLELRLPKAERGRTRRVPVE